ncbi:helix-turn-helix transcriptional regulator [Pseudofrankia sp. BMG5.37]|uniref:helix-turn-helix domain-containing protein n=1 Tax=Pseudofrankia sp. BMG5.37 TaxID=3050035 RepID=UPI002893C30D|nr:helix-turn-helix transcriptional regulator [Pseudofrankia sp. BMG5.37]MDT3438363.1 helix-turn-helix transcriptional regulator [Pseudofrankia sp. BMG5.37]
MDDVQHHRQTASASLATSSVVLSMLTGMIAGIWNLTRGCTAITLSFMQMATDHEHGSRLRAWRLTRGWRLADVADLTGYSISMISLVERGQRNLSAADKVRIAQALRCRVSDLFDIGAGDGQAA